MNKTNLHLDVNQAILRKCVSEHLQLSLTGKKLNWNVEPVTSEINFTTKGIYRVFGNVDNEIEWSLILKILQEVEDKLDPQHHNYWKREALVLTSTVLDQFNNIFNVPNCFHIECKEDRTIWLWMEEMKSDWTRQISSGDLATLAYKLGKFNGSYIQNSYDSNSFPWICRSWLASWTKSSQYYAIQVENYTHQLDPMLKEIADAFMVLRGNLANDIASLKDLPQVLAHQDLSKGNVFISGKKLTLIDWQFMSYSGLGEDLGKMFGVMLSQGIIPHLEAEEYREQLLEYYTKGLQDAGWQGDKNLLKYGFYLSFSVRSVWEVPKLVEWSLEGKFDRAFQQLLAIVQFQLKTYDDVHTLGFSYKKQP
ncbi:phosphotransferase [Shouchella sp. JSM 1781072]|uniref:phosphotransferase n=1 Tax=Shouchella sp. JSM 1781072 TaxID=3344581 RepID=UPI0035C2667D